MKKQVISRFRRMRGMSEEKREELEKANARFDDWWARCRVCGTRRTGTKESLLNDPCPVCGARRNVPAG